MNPLRIAILGGCLNSGYGYVTFNQLYHRIMARALEKQLQRPVKVTLGLLNTHQHRGIVDKTSDMLQRDKPDIVIIQIRPDFLWGLLSAFWLDRSGSGLARLRKNPHHSHGESWPASYEDSICPMRRFAPWNLTIAKATGVTTKAQQCLKTRLHELSQLCEKNRAALALITPIFGSYYHPVIRRYTEENILPILQSSGLPLIDLLSSNAQRQSTSWADHFHLNAAGHQIAAVLAIQALLPLRGQSSHGNI